MLLDLLFLFCVSTYCMLSVIAWSCDSLVACFCMIYTSGSQPVVRIPQGVCQLLPRGTQEEDETLWLRDEYLGFDVRES